MKSRKLGRGLDSLLQKGSRRQESGAVRSSSPRKSGNRPGKKSPSRSAASKQAAVGERDRVVDIPVGRIQPNPFQPRLDFDKKELESLKTSIAKEGVLQPILVRQRDSVYQLVAGERRFRAAEALGLKSIPAIINDVPDEKLLELALIENLHREDLNPVDTAKAFRQLLNLKGWTQETLAQESRHRPRHRHQCAPVVGAAGPHPEGDRPRPDPDRPTPRSCCRSPNRKPR